MPIDALAAWVEGILPQASVVRKPSGAMFQIGTKIFAFTRPEGVAMKLPEARIAQLVEIRDASFLVMGTKTMREWVLLRYSSPERLSERRKAVRGSAELCCVVEEVMYPASGA